MRHSIPIAAATLLSAAAICGCGSSQANRVKVSAAQLPRTQHSSTTTTTTGARTSTTASTETSATTAASTVSETLATAQASTTRTASAPAFVGAGEAHGAALKAAMATIAEHGYTATDPSQYHADQTLRVLIANKTGAAEAHRQRAFFFLDGRYIGTDATAPSGSIAIVSQAETEVTLAYALYKPGESLCCPGGGTAKVRFQLNNGNLVALGSIPPVSAAHGLGRM